MLLNSGLGTLYAWSVFLAPYEAALGLTRDQTSLVFSTATFCFVAAMFSAPWVQARLTASRVAVLSGVMAAVGLALAGAAQTPTMVIAGYGLLFGTANGLGYALALQVVGQAFSARRGLAMGCVVAAYALGAAITTPWLIWGLASFGLRLTLFALAFSVLVPALIGALLLRDTGRVGLKPAAGRFTWPLRTGESGHFARLWLGFMLGASAGLLMIGHAAGLVETAGGTMTLIALGPVAVSLGNGAGRIAAGWLADRFPIRWVMTGATTLGAAAFCVSALSPTASTLVVGLGIVGIVYGVLAAAYPIAVAEYFGTDRVAAVFGVLFTSNSKFAPASRPRGVRAVAALAQGPP
ncbi:MFS transporter, partial [Allochromatium palmeri]